MLLILTLCLCHENAGLERVIRKRQILIGLARSSDRFLLREAIRLFIRQSLHTFNR